MSAREQTRVEERGEDLWRAVACAADLTPQRQAAALLLLQLAHDDLELPLDDAPEVVRALLAGAC